MENITNTLQGVHAEETAENKVQAVELLQGMTSEEMVALFMDNALVEPVERVYQLNSKGGRYYYIYNEEGEPEFYPSVTTILAQTMPKDAFLIKWMCEKGYDEAERYKMERANYGTFMHAAFEELIINRKYDLDKLKEKLAKYIEQNRLPIDFINYADDLKKDVLAFAQFIKDYDVRPVAVEVSMVSKEWNYAGMCDLVCDMQTKKGGAERCIAMVDFKSGRNGFHEDYEIQLHMYKMMWEENYPNIPIARVYNFSPKDWRKGPTYNLKDQTDSAAAKKIPYLLQIALLDDDKKERTFTHTGGEIDLNSDAGLENNILSLTLSEIVARKAENKPSASDEEENGITTPEEE